MKIISKRSVFFEKEDRNKLRHITVRSIAKALGVSPSYAYDMITGKRPIPNKHLWKLLTMEKNNEEKI